MIMRRKTRIFLAQAILLVVSGIFGLLVGEVAVRFVRPQNLSGAWRVHSARGNLVNEAGVLARHQLGERVVRYRINEDHLRGPSPGQVRPRVLCLGDSYTFGWLVDEADCYVSLISKKFPKHEFLNGGAGGWGAADYVSFTEEFAESLKPQTILVFLNFEDISRSLGTRQWAWEKSDGHVLKPVVNPTSPSLLKQIARKLPAYQWLLEHSHLLQLARQSAIAMPSKTSNTPPPAVPAQQGITDGVRLGQALFTRLHSWCQQHESRLIIMNTGLGLCHWEPETQDGQETNINRAFCQAAPEFFAKLGVPYVDLTEDLERATKGDFTPFRIPVDLHFNEAGHRLFAETAVRRLQPLMVETMP